MRNKLLVIVLFSLATNLFAQDIAFKVITCTDNITIDGVKVTPGMNVPMSKSRINIPLSGNMWVIIPKGTLVKVDNNLRVDKVKKKDPANRITATGSVHRSLPPVEFPMMQWDNRKTWMIGDTVFTFWKVNYWRHSDKPMKPFTFSLKNMFDESLTEQVTDKLWVLINIAELKKSEPVLVYDLANSDGAQGLIKLMKQEAAIKKREEIQQQQNPFVGDEDFAFYTCAIYQSNQLTYDQQFSIYKILSSKKVASDPLLNKYFEWLSKKYDFSKLEFD